MDKPKGLSVTIDDVRNPEVLSWLMENQSEYEMNISATNRPAMSDESVADVTLLTSIDLSSSSSFSSSSNRVNARNVAKTLDGFNDEELDINSCRESLSTIPTDIGGVPTKDSILKSKGYEHTIGGMIDSTDLYYRNHEYLKLYQRFNSHGYILLSNVLDQTKILTAQNAVKTALQRLQWIKKDGKSAMSQGIMVDRAEGNIISGISKNSEEASGRLKIWKDVGTGNELKEAVCQPAITELITALAEGKAAYDQLPCEGRLFEPLYSWLRIKKPGDTTPVHADQVFFKLFTEMFNGPKALGDSCLLPKGDRSRCCHVLCTERRKDMRLIRCDECFWTYHLSCVSLSDEHTVPQDQWFCHNCQPRLVGGTCWVPLQDVDAATGTMAVLPGTMNLPFPDRYYGNHQIANSYYTHTRGLSWHVASSLKVGDILLFDWRLVHAATKNMTDKPRMSLDFRFVLKPQRVNHMGTSINGYVHMNTIPVKQLLTSTGTSYQQNTLFTEETNHNDITDEAQKNGSQKSHDTVPESLHEANIAVSTSAESGDSLSSITIPSSSSNGTKSKRRQSSNQSPPAIAEEQERSPVHIEEEFCIYRGTGSDSGRKKQVSFSPSVTLKNTTRRAVQSEDPLLSGKKREAAPSKESTVKRGRRSSATPLT